MRAVARLLALLGVAAAVAACEVTSPDILIEPKLVVHAVLDPDASYQEILLTSTRGGEYPWWLPDTGASPLSRERIVSGARVVLYASNGDSAVVHEHRDAAGAGTGIYRVFNTVWGPAPFERLPIMPGSVYRLRIWSSLGEAEGTTRVPLASGSWLLTFGRSIRLGVDTLVARRTVLQAGGMLYGAFMSEPGQPGYGPLDLARNPQPVLVGFESGASAFGFAWSWFSIGATYNLSVAAVDSSYYEYYARHEDEDPFAPPKPNPRLRGALGVFGSVLHLEEHIVRIVAP